MNTIGVILHIPHSSKSIPANVRKTFLLSDKELKEELIRMTDAYTDELFTEAAGNDFVVIYPVSRLVIDPERFVEDSKEFMSKHGMGAVYTLTSEGKKLRRSITKNEKNTLINTYYCSHHDKVSLICERQIKKHGKCLIIDCHSFPSFPFLYESGQSTERPDICIGIDGFHTPCWLSNEVEKLFQNLRYSVKINHPFSGSFTPNKLYHVNKNVLSIMIEINRKLYMNEKTGEKNDRFTILQNQLTSIIEKIIAKCNRKNQGTQY